MTEAPENGCRDTERPRLVQFLGPAGGHLHAAVACICCRRQEPALSDSRLALDQHDRRPARRNPVQGLAQGRDLHRTPPESQRRRRLHDLHATAGPAVTSAAQ